MSNSASDGETSDDSSDDSSVTTSGTTPMECTDAGGVCVAEVPGGWTGPIAVGRWAAGETAIACPGDWPMAATAGIDLTALPATCGCNCTPTVGSCSVSYAYYAESSCGTEILSGSTDQSCSHEITIVAHRGVIASVAAPGSSCAPTPVTTIPEVAWAQNMIACKPDPIGICGDGPCMPAASAEFGERYCIMAPGDTPCPAGPYIARSVAYSEVEDTRGCAACECGTSATCNGGLREYYSGFCNNTPGVVTANGTCQASLIPDEYDFAVAYAGDAPNVACTPNTPAATGSASPGNPMTVCCVP